MEPNYDECSKQFFAEKMVFVTEFEKSGRSLNLKIKKVEKIEMENPKDF